MADYTRAPEVADIVDSLIRDVEDHKLLDLAHIECVFRDSAMKSKGRTVFAKARRVTGRNAFLINAASGLPDYDCNDAMFVIEVSEDTWRRLDGAQQRALIDHELCHCHVELDGDGEPKLSIRGHDLEEFGAVVERHGLWASDVANFGSKVADQLALAVDEAVRFVEEIGEQDEDDDA